MVKAQLQLLWKLQTLEGQLAEAQQEKESYPVTLERLQSFLKEQEEQKERAKKEIEELEKERVKMEGELAIETEKLKRSQLKLLEIKTNKEYLALLHEIEGGKERNSQREEEIIKLLEEIDQRKADYVSTAEKIKQERAAIEDEQAKVKNQMAKVEQDIVRWQQTRQEILQQLAPEHLKRYTMLKERRNGIAVVLVKNEGCQGCFVNIPPQLYNEVQKYEEIILCPNCNRILYWEGKGTD
jgi:predicted  nucleic acid-binding Zn-ribbon protein